MAQVEAFFTPTQREVLDLIWSTQTEAKVGRRSDVDLQNSDPFNRYRFEHVVRPTRPIDFPVHPGEFVLKLHERKPDALLSKYYVNLRHLPDDLLTKVAEAIAEGTQGITVECCTGIPNAGDPIAKKYSEITGIPLLTIFGKAEAGSNRKIVAAPDVPAGNDRRLLLLDDLITEADTKFEAATAAQDLGYHIVAIGVLVDRQQGGVDQLREQGFSVVTSLPISKAFEYYYLNGNTDYNRYLESMDYLNNARQSAGLAALELLSS